jgi:anti-anti-sigma regulatory factor
MGTCQRSAMLKIQRSSNGEVVFTLIGRIGMEHVPELQRLFSLEETGRQVSLDLQEVTLVERDAIKFLAECEADKIRLENCPAYVRAWVDRERDREKKRE